MHLVAFSGPLSNISRSSLLVLLQDFACRGQCDDETPTVALTIRVEHSLTDVREVLGRPNISMRERRDLGE
ncbi:MAG: hypothetical protein ACRDHF_02855 [Tepidiformaceae bacterium]